jgi:hypothetical protein
LTGIATWLFEIMMETIVVQRWILTQNVINNVNFGVGYVVYFFFTAIVGLAAVCLTVFVSPLAAGGGGSELMGYFNGVNY